LKSSLAIDFVHSEQILLSYFSSHPQIVLDIPT
jgi:hypothetical protein